MLYMPLESFCIDKALDLSIYGNHGTIYGASWVVGKHGKALSFDGINDYVRVLDNQTLKGAVFTKAIWFKVLGLHPGVIEEVMRQDYRILISHRGDLSPTRWQVGFQQSDGVARYWVCSADVLADGQWHHVAVAADGSNWAVYHNGVQVIGGSYDGTVKDLGYDLFIGSHDGLSRFINAIVDDVYFFNRALSQSEIRRLYELGYVSFRRPL